MKKYDQINKYKISISPKFGYLEIEDTETGECELMSKLASEVIKAYRKAVLNGR